MQAAYDDNVLDYWKLEIGNYIVKLKKNDGLDGDNDIKTTLLFQFHLGAFTWCESKRFRNRFFREINGFYNKSIFCGDTDSLLKKS